MYLRKATKHSPKPVHVYFTVRNFEVSYSKFIDITADDFATPANMINWLNRTIPEILLPRDENFDCIVTIKNNHAEITGLALDWFTRTHEYLTSKNKNKFANSLGEISLTIEKL